MAVQNGVMHNVLCDGRFSDAVGPDKNDVCGILDELQAHQLGDGRLVSLRGPVPVEVSEWFEPVRPEYSCSLRKIDMVKAVSGWEFNNVAGFRYSYWTTVRRIAVQGLVCSPRMVAIQIRRHKSLEMPLVEHDDMVEKFSA